VALREFGFRVVIASSFGGIFYNNCFMNGILPVELPIEAILKTPESLAGSKTVEVVVDLEESTITTEDGGTLGFSVPTIARQMLLEGKDDIGLTLDDCEAIADHWQSDRKLRPWIDLAET
jgi:3-isopropylmalate/(R)-2-methylmalate dehydratase small subunit